MADRPAAAEQETAVAVLGPATAAGDPHASNADAALSKKLCAFCGGDAGAFGGNLGRMQGPFFTSSKGHDAPIYVHHECALWSPQITVDAWNRLQSVAREVRRARNLRCSLCDRPGAALGCRVPSCPRCFHLPCAIEHGCWFNFELYLMSCQEHSALFKKEPAGRQGRAVAGPLKHLKLSSRHLLSGMPKLFAGSEAAAAAAAVLGNSSAGDGRRRARAASGSKRRNRMSAEELGEHIAAAEEAYLGLVDELRRGEESEDDDAVFARKNAKRFRKAEELLAPMFLQPPVAKQPRQQPPQRAQEALPAPPAQQGLPPEAQERYRQHIQQAHVPQHVKKPIWQQPQQQQQQQGAGWQPSSEGFKGVGGLDDAKRQLREMVLMPLTYPDLYRSLGIHPPRGILLHGPPGTGKTALVRALAAECAALSAQPSSGNSSGDTAAPKPVALFVRKGTDCLGKYAGDAELHLRMLFEMAAASAPSIIFLDELDGLVPARSVRSGGSDQIFASIVSVLLALMDGLTDRGQVLVIGATNRPDNIDPALRRPGRFDREVFVGLPGAQHRADILALHTAKWTPPPTRQQLQLIAAQTEGWAGADLQSLAASALLAAVRRITPQLLDSMGAQQRQQQQAQLGQPHQGQQGFAKAADKSSVAAAAAAATAAGTDFVAASGSSADGCAAAAAAAAAVAGVGGLAEAAPTQTTTLEQETQIDAACSAQAQVAAAAAASGGLGHAGAAGAAGGSPDAPARGEGFLAALHEFVTVKPGSDGFLFSPPRTTPPLEPDNQQNTQNRKQQSTAAAGAERQQQQQPAAEHQAPAVLEEQQHQQQEQERPQLQQQEPTPSATMVQQVQQQQQRLSPGPASGLPPRVPRPRSGSRTKSPATKTALPAALQTLQVLACDWSTALAELGPPASKRGSHNLPALSPAAALPGPLAPLLLPALTRVVDVLQGWLLLAAQDQADWQQAKAGHADLARIAGVARAGGGDGGAASDAGVDGGVSQTAAADLLTAWGAVERLPSTAAATAAAAAGVEDARVCRGSGMGVSDPPHAPPALQQQVLAGLFGGSNLLGAGGTHQLQHGSSSSSTPHCLLLSGHGPEGQSEVAAATLKLLESRAGAAVYTLGLPVMLLLGEGSASAGLVSGVQEALARTSSAQPLVIYLPRLELWALEAAKPGIKDAARTAAAAAAADGQTGPLGQKRAHQTLGGWCSGLRGAFSSTDSSSEGEDLPDADDGYDSDGSEAAVGQQQQQQQQLQHPNNINNCNGGLEQAGMQQGQHRHSQHRRERQQRRQQQAGEGLEHGANLQFSAAWSVFEQQLAMLHSQRQLLILATTQLPVQELPCEMQQLFGWQQQRQQQQFAISAAGVDAGLELQLGCSNSRTVQLCECAGLGGSSFAAASTGAVRAALEEALDRAVQLAAVALDSSSSDVDAAGDLHSAQPGDTSSSWQPGSITNGNDIGVAGASSAQQQPVAAVGSEATGIHKQQQPVDALIAAALQQKDQQERQRQRQLPARVPTQQMLAAQQLGAPLKQLNDAQRAEAQTLLQQVQASLRHIASTVLHDPRLQLTHTQQQATIQPGSSPTILRVPPVSKQGQQQRQQQMLSAAAQMAPGAVRELEGCMPVAAVCVKALQGWYWGLDAFQTDLKAAAQSLRPVEQPTAATKRLCWSAAAATLADMVAAACHEARQRLRLYEYSRQQLLEAAALAKLSVQQQQELRGQQRHMVQGQQRQAGRGPKQQLSPPGAAEREAPADTQQVQQKQQQLQQPIWQQNEAAVRQDGVGNTLLPSNHMPAAQMRGPVQRQSGVSGASLAQNRAAQQQLVERLRAEAALVVAETPDSNANGPNCACCPAAAAFAAVERFWRSLNLAAQAQPTMSI